MLGELAINAKTLATWQLLIPLARSILGLLALWPLALPTILEALIQIGMMTKKEFERYVARDRHCYHCGTTEALAPNHRANRGHGGSKKSEVASNVVILCSLFNGLIESDSKAAALAKKFGWKISRYDNPLEMPVFDAVLGQWFLFDNNYQKSPLLK